MISEFFKNVGFQMMIHTCLGAVTYFVTKSMVFERDPESRKNIKNSAIWAVVIVGLTFLLIAFLFGSFQSANESNNTSYQRFDFNSVVSNIISFLILLTPCFITMRLRKESFASAGVSKRNLKNSIIAGLIISICALIFLIPFADQPLDHYLDRVSMNLFWGLLYFAVVGFGEEFLFRGYLQTRLMDWLGGHRGWIIASILMALMHIPQRIVMQGMLSTEALLSSIALIPVSMLHGYIMLRTKNVVAPGIVHTFANWYNIIFS